MQDSYRHKGLRKRLVDSLRTRGITDEKVLSALAMVPRHLFLEKAFEEHAYDDKAFPIGSEQTISQPYTVAYQTVLLDVQPTDRILEIGTGSGYQAAVLAAMGARVYTIERQEPLYIKSRELLRNLGFNKIRCFFGDGTQGLADFAPYDKIIVTAGAPVVPNALRMQLQIGGYLIIPVGEEIQYMYRYTRLSETEFKEECFDAFRFVPFLEGVEKKR
ncbi:MAG: protein-L-isoaspartate(D-aspartate) O-methyltransferase [Lewinellaceae bacterium]|nr:protein-L-isoaspartate(D-aspartate) O-methyltransferase [Lewinellaceae bacterium]